MLLSDSSSSLSSAERSARRGERRSGELVLAEDEAGGASAFVNWLLRGGCFAHPTSAAASEAEVDLEARELARIHKFHPEIYEALHLLEQLPRRLPKVQWFECPFRRNQPTTVTLLNSGVDSRRIAAELLIKIGAQFPATHQIAYAMYWGLSVIRGNDTDFSSLVDALLPVLRQRGLEIKIDDRGAEQPSFTSLTTQFPELKCYRSVRTMALRQVRDGTGDLQSVVEQQEPPAFVVLSRARSAAMFAITPDYRYAVFDAGSVQTTDAAVTYNLDVPRTHAIRDPSATSFEAASEAIEFLISLFDKDPAAARSATLVWTLAAHGATALLDSAAPPPAPPRSAGARSVQHTMRALEGRGI